MSNAKQTTGEKPKRTRPAAKPTPTTASFRVSDELWAELAPLIPEPVNTHRFGGGRPRVPERQCATGICYVLRTGCQWQALDQTGICAGSTAPLRFQDWVAAGVFLQFWEAGLEQYDAVQGVDWRGLRMDGAMTKAPVGGEKNREKPHGARAVGRQKACVDGSPRRARRAGRRGRQAPRSEAGAADGRQYPGRTSRANPRAAARDVPG